MRRCDALYLPEAGIGAFAIKLRAQKEKKIARAREREKERERTKWEKKGAADAKKLSGFANPCEKHAWTWGRVAGKTTRAERFAHRTPTKRKKKKKKIEKKREKERNEK